MCDHPISFTKTNPNAVMPRKAHDHWLCGDAAYDLFPMDPVNIPPLSQILVDTGLKFIIPGGFWIKFHERSGLANKGIHVHGGVIDNTYTGNLKVILSNINNYSVFLHSNKAIAQFTLEEMRTISFTEVTNEEYEIMSVNKLKFRGTGGFGSSDVTTIN